MGRAYSIALAREGAKVVVNYANRKDAIFITDEPATAQLKPETIAMFRFLERDESRRSVHQGT